MINPDAVYVQYIKYREKQSHTDSQAQAQDPLYTYTCTPHTHTLTHTHLCSIPSLAKGKEDDASSHNLSPRLWTFEVLHMSLSGGTVVLAL